MKLLSKVWLAVAVSCVLLGCKNGDVLKLYFHPLRSMEVMEKNVGLIKDFLEKETGLKIKPTVAKDYVSIVEGLGEKDVDAAFMNPLGYLLAHDWCGAAAVLKTIYKGHDTYQSAIIVRKDGGIKSLKDLNGKSVAFTEPFSTSGYLLAKDLFVKNNVKPSKEIFAGDYAKAIEMVYKGETAAAAIYYDMPDPNGAINDARLEVLDKYQDIVFTTDVIALSGKVTNSPVVVRKGISDAVKQSLTKALTDFAVTPEGREAFRAMYGFEGFAPAKDSDYDNIRTVLQDLGRKVEETVPGGISFYTKKLGGKEVRDL